MNDQTSTERVTSRALLSRLQQFSFAERPISLEPLSGGITNQNFLVRAANGCFVARVCQPRPDLGIDRRNEALCHQIAASLGLAPRIVEQTSDIIVYRWIDGRSLTSIDLREPELLERVGRLIDHLHAGWDTLEGGVLYFCPFQTIRGYASTAARLGASLSDDLPDLLADLRRRSHALAAFRPVLCHNDLLPANLIDDGSKLWLVDWEYAGIGHPLFDLANLSANANLCDDANIRLLDAYHGRDTTATELSSFRLLRASSFLRESLWASIQTVTATIDFDYRSYSAQNLESFRSAHARLDHS